MGVDAFLLHQHESSDEPQHCPQQAQQRRQLRDGCQQVQFVLQSWDFRQTGFLQRLAHPLPAMFAVENCRSGNKASEVYLKFPAH